MAVTAVSTTIDKISQLIISEAKFLSSVKDEVDKLQNDLHRMQSFLKDAGHKQGQEELVRQWVAEISSQ